MQHASVRALRRAARLARCLLATPSVVVISACGTGGEADASAPTGPGEFPSVVGQFQRSDLVAALSCVPQTIPPGGDVATDSYTLVEPVRITQSGSKVSLSYVNFPSDPPDTGSIDMAGKVKLGFKLSFRESKVRDGNRQFYVDVVGTFALDRLNDGALLKGTGTYQNVFHEGSASAPVFTTCSRTSDVELTRVGA